MDWPDLGEEQKSKPKQTSFGGPAMPGALTIKIRHFDDQEQKGTQRNEGDPTGPGGRETRQETV